MLLASDVDNPLLGERDAAAVYGPQKGAHPAQVVQLEGGLARLAAVLATASTAARESPAERLPGAGAAGGVGFAALAVLGARARPGIELLLELTGFSAKLAEASLVVTGEGSLDEQTLQGKAPVGVAAARAAGLPVAAVAGRCPLAPERLAEAGFADVYTLAEIEPDLQRCMAHAGPLLEEVGRRLAGGWLVVDPDGAHSARNPRWSS